VPVGDARRARLLRLLRFLARLRLSALPARRPLLRRLRRVHGNPSQRSGRPLRCRSRLRARAYPGGLRRARAARLERRSLHRELGRRRQPRARAREAARRPPCGALILPRVSGGGGPSEHARSARRVVEGAHDSPQLFRRRSSVESCAPFHRTSCGPPSPLSRGRMLQPTRVPLPRHHHARCTEWPKHGRISP